MKALEKINLITPSSLQEALEIQADEATRGLPLAGGTDLMVQWEAGVLPLPDRLLDISGIAELKTICEEGSGVRIGGGVTHMELRRSAILSKYVPSLAEAAATVGGYQMQYAGTVGGSMANASPAGDLAPSLLISDGSVGLMSAKGSRSVPLSQFWTGYREIDMKPDELIVSVSLPGKADDETEHFRKLGPRKAQAISKVMGSFRGGSTAGTVTSFKVALGSIAPTAIRLTALEEWLVGRPLNEETLVETEEKVSEMISPIADIRSTAEYRKWVSGRLVRSFVEQLSA